MSEKRKFEVIDGLRGFGALCVVLYHHLGPLAEKSPAFKSVLFNHAQLLPEFFVISGFLLYYRLCSSELSPHWRSEFWIRRFFRIIPLWWLLVFSTLRFHRVGLSVYLSNIFLTSGFYAYDPRYLIITPSWSLTVEETFYLVLPLIFPLLQKGKNVLVFLVCTFLLAHYWVKYAFFLGVPTANFHVERNFLANVQYFFCGIGLAFAYLNLPLQEWLSNSRFQVSTLILEVIFFLFYFFIESPFSIEVLTTGVLLLSLSKKGLFSTLYSWKPFRWIGIRCYGFYILQEYADDAIGLKSLFSKLIGIKDQTTLELVWLPFSLALLCFLAGLSWKYLEKPCMRFGERKIKILREGRWSSVQPSSVQV